MSQEVFNEGSIDQQNNFGNVDNVYLTPKSKWQKRFEKLQEEVRKDERYESFIEDFHNYNTIQDGIGLEQKLIDAGFNNAEISLLCQIVIHSNILTSDFLFYSF